MLSRRQKDVETITKGLANLVAPKWSQKRFYSYFKNGLRSLGETRLRRLSWHASAVTSSPERGTNMRANLKQIVLTIPIILWSMDSAAQGLPTHEGACVHTKIAQLEHRLHDTTTGAFDPHSGSAISFTNGGYQVSYEELPVLQGSRKGDPVLMCLIRIPRDCPPGDARGRVYTTTNLRTVDSWTMGDAEHSCGGA